MGLIADMQARGVWDACQRYVIDLEPILVATSRRGLPISAERHAEVTAEFQAEMVTKLAEIQALVPDELKKVRVYKTTKAIAAHGGAEVRETWKPSNPALVRYMQFRGHNVPKDWRTDKDTTKQDELARLARSTGDPLYSCVQEYRGAQTVLRNHLKNWRPCA